MKMEIETAVSLVTVKTRIILEPGDQIMMSETVEEDGDEDTPGLVKVNVVGEVQRLDNGEWLSTIGSGRPN